MIESNTSDAALAELLTLTVEVDSWGDTVYCNHLGQKHRVHGPASITPAGNQYWYQNGGLHREDGPAVVWANGTEWWLNDKKHRTDGPAIEWGDGRKHWYLYDEKLSEEEFNERIKSL